MPEVYRAADLCVCRAGAMTVAELLVAGVPAILVPLPGAPRDHQTRNAEALVAAGAAILVPDAECTAERLEAEVGALLCDRERLASMAAAARALGHPDAAARVAAVGGHACPLTRDRRPRRAPRSAFPPTDPHRGDRRRRYERHRDRAAVHGPCGLGFRSQGVPGGGPAAVPGHRRGGGPPGGERRRGRCRDLFSRGATDQSRNRCGGGPRRARRGPFGHVGRHLCHPALPWPSPAPRARRRRHRCCRSS